MLKAFKYGILLAAALTASAQTTTFTTGAGTCRVSDCLFMPYTATDGTSQTLWISWAGQGYVLWSNEQPICTGVIAQVPVFTVSQSNPAPQFGQLTGSCVGTDSSGFTYTLQFSQTMEAFYSRGGGGKGGGGAGVKRMIVTGSFSVTY